MKQNYKFLVYDTERDWIVAVYDIKVKQEELLKETIQFLVYHDKKDIWEYKDSSSFKAVQ